MCTNTKSNSRTKNPNQIKNTYIQQKKNTETTSQKKHQNKQKEQRKEQNATNKTSTKQIKTPNSRVTWTLPTPLENNETQKEHEIRRGFLLAQ